MTHIKTNRIRIAFVLCLIASSTSLAWQNAGISIGWGGGNVHGHGGNGGVYGHGGYYDRGGYFYGGGWSGPNVIINVPVEPYYVPVCENMEVCDSYGQCWLERYCD